MRATQAALLLMFLALAIEPLYGATRFPVGPIPTTLLEVVLVLAIGAGLVAGGKEIPLRNPYTIPGVLLLVAAGLDTYFSPDRRAAAGTWKAYFAEPALAFLVIAYLADGRDRVRLLLGGLAVAGLVVATAEWVAFAQAVTGSGYDQMHPPRPSFYVTPNAVALFLVPLVAVAFAVAAFAEGRRERIAAAIFAAVTVAAVVMSLSRGGVLALVVVGLFVAAFHPWRVRVFGVVVILAAVLFAVSKQARLRVLVELTPSDPNNTVQTRLANWRSTLHMLRVRPVFGGGLDGFKRSILAYKDPSFVEPDVNYPHNLILNFWSETGILGLLAFLFLLGVMVVNALNGLRSEPWVRTLSIGLLAAFVGIAVHGLVDVPYFKNDLALEFWALLGIQFGAIRSADPTYWKS